MSKMSEIAMELDDCAIELGFESYEEAIAKGYEVDYENRTLINPYVLDKDDKPTWCKRLESYDEEQDEAHEAWLKERDIVVGDLTNLLIHRVFDHDIIERAIKFVKEAHD